MSKDWGSALTLRECVGFLALGEMGEILDRDGVHGWNGDEGGEDEGEAHVDDFAMDWTGCSREEEVLGSHGLVERCWIWKAWTYLFILSEPSYDLDAWSRFCVC